jgi:predicted metal-dependent hydrolase
LLPATIVIDGCEIPVAFRHHSRARRLIVRLDRTGRGVVVTLPLRASRDEGLAFAHRSAEWIAERLALQGMNVAFAHGAEFPLRGRTVRILHQARARGTVWFEEETACLHVAGGIDHINRRVTDWLKTEARRDLVFAAETYARAMGVAFRRISIRDQKSRWGSCNSDGHLSFSWRLIMAPPHVLDYVAAHEVAHLRHMDHSMRFWRLVLSHCHGAGQAKTWLKANSTALHKYGQKP